MKRFPFMPIFFILILSILLGVAVVQSRQALAAAPLPQQDQELVRGARLYDDWTEVIGLASPPSGDQPIWSRQSTNTRRGPDTWRCVSCHGWDYQGEDGAYRSGANFTGFPGVYTARTQPLASLSAAISGELDAEHDFSGFLVPADINALAKFIQEGLIDDNEFIDPVSMKIIGGDAEHGRALYEQGCASCHGPNGQQIEFRYEGQDIVLGTLANQDPWRFLHRTRFGTARAPEMTIGYDLGWTAQDGRDLLLYAQTFPTGLAQTSQPSMSELTPGPVEQPGGPARNIFSGILTGLGAMATSLGFAIALGVVLVAIIFLVVWLLRGRSK